MRQYDIEFCEKFWPSVTKLGLDRGEVMMKALAINRSPDEAKELGKSGSSIRVADFKSESGQEFRWYYIIEDGLGCVFHVYVEEDNDTKTRQGKDVMLFALLVRMLLRVIFGE